jgi:hypothetical protein
MDGGHYRTSNVMITGAIHIPPSAVILNADRKKYYQALKDADREKYNGFMNFIGRSIERSLLIYLNALKSKNDTEDKYGYINY